MRRPRKKRLNSTFQNLTIVDLERERKLISLYGLKNKKQIRIFEYKLRQVRAVFRNFLPTSVIYSQVINKCVRLGLLKDARIEDLTLESFLNRRLQSLVCQKFNLKPLEARQIITHGKVIVGDKVRRHPNYLIRLQNEESIHLR